MSTISVTDPTSLTPIPERSQAELEEFAIFAICVAGKTARVVQRQLREFWDVQLTDYWATHTAVDPSRMLTDAEWTAMQPSPFRLMKRLRMEEIQKALHAAGIGCHTSKGRGIYELSRKACLSGPIDLATCTPAELENIHGIGMKTSRFFIMYTQPGARVAALDTHILRWLREQGVDAPHQSHSGRRYLELEEQFINLVPPEKSIAEMDLEIWNRYSRKVKV